MKRDDAVAGLLAVTVVLAAVALGYLLGSSGPWRAYAGALEEIVRVRDAQITQTKQQIQAEVQPAFQELNSRLADAKRFMRNMLDGEVDEVREQAEARLEEWQ